MSIAEVPSTARSRAGGRASTCLFVLSWLALAGSASAQPRLPPEIAQRYLTLPCPMSQGQRNELRVEYREILERWSRHDRGAVVDLEVLGRRIVDEAAGFEVTDQAFLNRLNVWKTRTMVPGLSCLDKTEHDLLEELMVAEPASRTPLWALYLALYQRQSRAPDSTRRWLSLRTRQRLDTIAGRGRRGGEPRDSHRSDSALMMMALAIEMQSSPFQPLIVQAQDRFERAVALAPESFAARYWAGSLAEILGDYDQALRRFAELGDRHPSDPEVELRLALCRARTGKRRAARKDLARIVDTTAPDWLVIVAYEELARLQARGSSALARKTLIAAVERFPDEPQLRLQLIHSLALESAWTAIDEMAPTLNQALPEEDQPSPRLLYNIPRRDELEADLVRFEQRVNSQFPATIHVLTLVPRNGDPQP